jgi:hypothetical protein
MNVSEVLDIKPSGNESGQPIHPGDRFTVTGFETKMVDSVGAKCAMIHTREGEFYSFAKAVVGQAESDWWIGAVEKTLEKDASDGLNVWVVEKPAKGSNRTLISLSAFEPGATTKV